MAVKAKWRYEHSVYSEVALPFSGSVHLLLSNTRWLSVLHVPCIGTGAALLALLLLGLRNARLSKRFSFFVNNALRHSGYENTQLHRHSTRLNVLMFEFASPSFFLWSHEQWIKYTVIRKVRYRCTLTGVKVHLSRFKNKLYAMSILIYIPQISCGAGEASIKLTGFKTSQEYY